MRYCHVELPNLLTYLLTYLPSGHSMVYRYFRIGLEYVKTDVNV